MDVLEALADDVSLSEFFLEWVPKIFEARRTEFEEASDIDFILCFKFEDTGEVYSISLSHDGIEVEDDEMIDFPAVTLLGFAKFWDTVKTHSRPLVEALEDRRHQAGDAFRITEAFFADWEKFDLVVDIEITSDEAGEPVTFSLVLNDYDAPDRAKRFGFSLPLETLEEVASGEQEPEEVARALKISGDYKAAATFGGMIMTHR